MGLIGKTFALFFILIMAFSCLSLLMVKPVNSQTPSIREQAIEILQNYATSHNATYVQPMINILEANPALNGSTNNAYAIAGNIKCTVRITQIGEADWQTVVNFNFIYIEDGVDYCQKAFNVNFLGGKFTALSDDWNLYSGPSKLSVTESEAEKTAWKAANNPHILTQEIGGVGDDTITLSGSPDVEIIGDQYNYTLRPMWAVLYYANASIFPFATTFSGVEVGVWADNGQIAYCTPYGFQSGTPLPIPVLSASPRPVFPELPWRVTLRLGRVVSVPELSWLVIVPLLLSLFSVAVILRHRKTANLSK
jgi:hypothetical protein